MQRKLSKLKKGAKERRKLGKAIAKKHMRMGHHRSNFCHQLSRKIVDQYQYICIEDLKYQKMIEKSSFAKNITDANWNQFRQCLTYKAEEAGRKLGLVNPAYTTQTCSQCNHQEEKSSLKGSTIVSDVDIERQGISMQQRTFWPSD